MDVLLCKMHVPLLQLKLMPMIVNQNGYVVSKSQKQPADKTGYPLHRENRENDPNKIPVSENTGNLEILPKHREFGFLETG